MFSALVPLKAHSERVESKNIKDFCGYPLYYHICQTLESSHFISEIIINTDSDVIQNQASSYFKKVKIVPRPKDLCGDFVSMNHIIEYDLQRVENEHVIQTHSTNPLLSLATLNKALSYYEEHLGVYDSVFSVTKIQNRLYDQKGIPVNHNPAELLRTQDLLPLFEENSNFYIFSKDSFRQKSLRIGESPYMFEVNKLEAVDIDTQEDFELAEYIYQTKRGLSMI